ncbi:MAG TPA: DUF58 domain-containing protein [Acidimicrobiales bacterium]
MKIVPSVAGTADARASVVLRRLELTISRKLDGLLQGEYRGLLPSLGSELGETREYQPGDDVRRIDWNVTARMQTPHVRETIADRELETWVCVDQSASLDFGTAALEKRDLVVAAVGAIAVLTAKVGNRLGALLVRQDGILQIPARQGRDHYMAVLHRLQTAPRATGPADLAAGIRRLGSPAHRRGLAVVVSDLLAPEGWQRELARVAQRHDLLVVEVIDPRELELPNVGVLALVDPETGQLREVNTRSAKLRERYAAAAREQREQHARAIREAGADHVVLRTDRDWLFDLVQFVALRRRRMEATVTR